MTSCLHQVGVTENAEPLSLDIILFIFLQINKKSYCYVFGMSTGISLIKQDHTHTVHGFIISCETNLSVVSFIPLSMLSVRSFSEFRYAAEQDSQPETRQLNYIIPDVIFT